MWMDERLEFADALDVSAVAGSLLEGDVIDSSTPDKDIGQGQPVYMIVQVDVAFVGGGASVDFQLRSDAIEAVNPTTGTLHNSTGAQVVANLAVGAIFVMALPMGTDYERYLGLVVVTSGATTTAGSVNAFLTYDPTGWSARPDGDK